MNLEKITYRGPKKESTLANIGKLPRETLPNTPIGASITDEDENKIYLFSQGGVFKFISVPEEATAIKYDGIKSTLKFNYKGAEYTIQAR